MSRICEEFHTDILGARRQPLPLALRIIEARDYARAKTTLDAWDAADTKSRGPAPTGGMVDRVRETRRRVREVVIARKRQARHG